MNQSSRTPSLLATLRALVPQRPLRFNEALRITELQANRCRDLLDIKGPDLPDSAIADIPRIRIIEVYDLPSSGVSQWHNGMWIIAVNALEPWQRQRFSVAHEFWHITNHPTADWLTPDTGRGTTNRSEQLADYFAGCLLMPKRHMKRLVGEGLHPTELADTFGVSARAIGVRLAQLGLNEERPRCADHRAENTASVARTTAYRPKPRRWRRERRPHSGPPNSGPRAGSRQSSRDSPRQAGSALPAREHP